ncbi:MULTISPECIES: DUF3761 domain-containing protein [Chromobacteriaceae]|uniref:Uncharacterized protein n=2 Tax=Chromobacteriaceae TaxID=1499392 RepID=A0A1D9LGJ6_9NEIS|nr:MULTISPECIES: DUF3761 domain-containing protein [Chromobacteriaceae]AOZ50314.1 hypothetical protein BKX93_10095 [Chromobacterium vaccinii]AVG14547.1 hypothetical protein CFN79_00910 [Chromobacterium vaccinii]QND83401.1 Uncharacterized protein ChrSW_1174 [Chromobacterium vaccinii]QND88632.1 Uncharacterized protein ChrSV_1174 [Chromobacterium vaccinii]
MLAAARIAVLATVLALSWQPAMAKRVAGSSNLVTEDSYVNHDGVRVHKPIHAKSKPANATARCRDGSYSFSTHHRGTCSGHRGVAEWYR